MEKKTKHRILGMLVVVALVLISLPLFQGGKETGTSASLVKAPPFPDQTVQVASTPTVVAEAKMPAIQPSPIPLHDPAHSNDNGGVNQLPDDTISANSPTEVVKKPNEPAIAAQPNLPTIESNKANENTHSTKRDAVSTLPLSQAVNDGIDSEMGEKDDSSEAPEGTDYIFKNSTPTTVTPEAGATVKKAKEVQKTTHFKVLKMHQTMKTPKKSAVENNGLLKLKNSVWVIQVGSFKNKENALRLVNKLRINGYRAFIQQASLYTQVFVGPEVKQNSARVLKRQLETDLHISGIVVSYKPLTL
jgi:DedD protein